LEPGSAQRRALSAKRFWVELDCVGGFYTALDGGFDAMLC